MAILHRFLHLLELLETVAEFGEFLLTPTGIVLWFCALSYQALIVMGCDVTTAVILASSATLTLHCTLNRPTY